MLRYVMDIEANGLMDVADRVWCIVLKNIDTNEVLKFPPHRINHALMEINRADVLIGHNIVLYDLPFLQKMFNIQWMDKVIHDTLIWSRLVYPNREGGHSLRQWGKDLGDYKGDFTDFSQYSHEMLEYCEQDVNLNHKVYNQLKDKIKEFGEANQIETEFAKIISQQILSGFPIAVNYAKLLYKTLEEEHNELQDTLRDKMDPVKITAARDTIFKEGRLIKEDQRSYTYITAKTKIIKTAEFKFQEPNLNSRKQIVDFFIKKYGWTPKQKTDKGTPQIDEKILNKLPYDEAPLFSRLFRLGKQMAMIDGPNGWLKYAKQGVVHGSVNTNGAVTGRCTHCVPMDSSALTRDGWKHYKELKIGDEVLGYDLETNTKKWTKILDLHFYKNKEVGEVGNSSRRLRCTANHKWVTYRENRGKKYYRLQQAKDFSASTSILTNAPYDNTNISLEHTLPLKKYNYNHVSNITRMNISELNSFLTGFLLADGYLKKSTNGDTKSWSFAQAEGEILEAARIALYLQGDTRISTTCKTQLKGPNQRYGYNITQTQTAHMRSKEGMGWKYTNNEDVWCPETELGTWVMKQGDIITITGNSQPNLAQIDTKDKRMRKCWVADKDWVLLSSDADQLEARLLAHYTYQFDNGQLKDALLGNNLHENNRLACGFEDSKSGYKSAKTALYAFIYGAGDRKLGAIARSDKAYTNKYIKILELGKQIRDSLNRSMSGIAELTKMLKLTLKSRDYIYGLDGRKVPIRSEHASLNSLIQSAGAIVMKKCLIKWWYRIHQRGLKYDRDFKLCANVHDEIVLQCRPEIADELGREFNTQMAEVAKSYNIKCELPMSYEVGSNWSEIH